MKQSVFNSFIILTGIISCCCPTYAQTEYWFLIDSSQTMSATNVVQLRDEAAILHAKLLLIKEPSSKVGVINFATKIKKLDLTKEIKMIENFINNIGASGRLTDIKQALDCFIQPSENKRVLFLFSDGHVDVYPPRGFDDQPTKEDRNSIRDIEKVTLPELSKQNDKLIIHAVGFPDKRGNVNSDLLKMITSRTNGIYKEIKNIKDSLEAFWWIERKTNYLNPNLVFNGQELSVDNKVTRSFFLFGPKGFELISPERGSKFCQTTSTNKQVCYIPNPDSGTYIIGTGDAKDVEIMSYNDIVISEASLYQKNSFYQFEVVPIKIALAGKNEDILNDLRAKKIHIEMCVTGLCKDYISLVYNKIEEKSGQEIFLYEKEWWIKDCKLDPDPGKNNIHLKYFIKDNSNLKTRFPYINDFKKSVKQTVFDFQILQKPASDKRNYKRNENTFLIGDQIKPELLFELTDMIDLVKKSEIQYVLNNNQIKLGVYYTFREKDLGKHELIANVTCKDKTSNDVFFKLTKGINIKKPPFIITPKNFKNYISYLPVWLKPFVNSDEIILPDKIDIPFQSVINVDALSLFADVEMNNKKVMNNHEITLHDQDSEFSIPLSVKNYKSIDRFEFKVSFSSTSYLKEPITIDLTLKVESPWPGLCKKILFPLIIFVISVSIIYIVILIITIISKPLLCSVKTKGADGNDTVFDLHFPMRFFPPSRWEVIKDNDGKKLCKIYLKKYKKFFKYNMLYFKAYPKYIIDRKSQKKYASEDIQTKKVKIIDKKEFEVYLRINKNHNFYIKGKKNESKKSK